MLPSFYRETYFRKICPRIYQDTNVNLLPSQARSLSAELLKRPYSPRGVLFTGNSRLGKSRLMWLLIRKYVMEDGISCNYFDGVAWGTVVARIFRDPDFTEDWLNGMRDLPILFLDDLFKGKLTDTQQAALFGVLERRIANKRPIFITTNTNSIDLVHRTANEGFQAHEWADPFNQRIREFCDVFAFTKGPT